MAKIIGLPKLSPTMEQGTLLSWAKKEGDAIEVDDLLAEVETDKATMEFRSFDRGVLLKILVEPGAILEPDVPVAIVGNKDEDISDLLSNLGTGIKVPPSPKEKKDVTKKVEPSGAADSGSDRHEDSASTEDSLASRPTSDPVNEDVEIVSKEEEKGRVHASPVVRKIAREKGINLQQVSGTGPHGRVIKRDLQNVQPSQKTAILGDRPASIVTDASPMRKTIARRLVESKTTIPHYYLSTTINATPLWNAREQINGELAIEKIKVSFNDLIIKAVAVALHKHPRVNASWVNEKIVQHQVIDISIAVAVEDGLVTPVVRDADKKNIAEIARETRDLAERARSKKLRAEDIQGGTFSVSNLGMFGTENFAAVINPPQGAILAIGAIRNEPVLDKGQVVAGRRLSMTISADHRVIDGAVGAAFLDSLKTYLENPVTIFLR